MTDYNFNATDTPDAKRSVVFLDEIRFDILSRGESLRDRNLMKN